jgi:hypothetical protein
LAGGIGMGITADIAYSKAKKLVAGIQSGFDHATETKNADGTVTMTMYFTNGTNLPLTFPKPNDGEKGDDGASVISASVKNKHLILTKDDGTEIDCGVLPTSDYDDTELRGLIVDKVDKEAGKSLVDDTEIARLANVDNYDDTGVKNSIQTVANGLMASAGYSADYKTIDIVTVGGAKKSIDVKPVIEHANLEELEDVDGTNKANGKTLVYNAATGKHEYSEVSGTDELVKMDSSGDAKHLSDLIDKVTVVNENGTLKVKKLDGQEATIEEINYLKGLTMNVMDLVNLFANGGVKIIDTPVATYADLLVYDKSALIEGISYLIYVLADETHDGSKTTYLIDKDSSNPSYFGFADNHRDFTTNPINLVTEITGKLGASNIDTDALFALLSVDDTYKTETSTNNIFSTHGAKALYDELVQAIGLKANTSDLTTHTSDTSIHVISTEKENWNKVSEKANETDLTTHTGNTDIHITSAERTSWNGKIDKTSIATTIDDTCTDEQVASALVTKTELDKKIDKTSISKSISISSTHDEIATSKSIFSSLNGVVPSNEIITKANNSVLQFPFGNWSIHSSDFAKTLDDLPVQDGGVLQVLSNWIADNNPWNTRYCTRTYRYSNYKKGEYIRYLYSGDTPGTLLYDSGWRRVCSTKVDDVALTNIKNNLLSSKVSLTNSDSYAIYTVKNGICYISIWSLKISESCNVETLFTGLPKPLISQSSSLDASGTSFGLVFIKNDGSIDLNADSTCVGKTGYCTFSYPVAES